jgi:hypothetical protein
MRFLALPLALALLGCAPAPGPVVPQHPVPVFHSSGRGLARPPLDSIRNANGSPRLASDGAWQEFWKTVAPELERWARDPRLGVNPALVAALLAKESGFEAQALSPAGAYGMAQLTPAADTDLRTRAGTPLFAWALPELQRWPRDSVLRAGGGGGGDSAAAARSLARGRALADSLPPAAAARADYLFDPLHSARAATIWLRMLAEIWTTDSWPGAYGSLARQKLNGGAPITESALLELVVVSYNQGALYAQRLVDRWGADWTRHLDPEPADYLERVRAYVTQFQR